MQTWGPWVTAPIGPSAAVEAPQRSSSAATDGPTAAWDSAAIRLPRGTCRPPGFSHLDVGEQEGDGPGRQRRAGGHRLALQGRMTGRRTAGAAAPSLWAHV